MAEREGFEPPIRLPVCRISSAVHSTTLPPLQQGQGRGNLAKCAKSYRRGFSETSGSRSSGDTFIGSHWAPSRGIDVRSLSMSPRPLTVTWTPTHGRGGPDPGAGAGAAIALACTDPINVKSKGTDRGIIHSFAIAPAIRVRT